MSVSIYLDNKSLNVGWNGSFVSMLNNFQQLHRPNGESYLELYKGDIDELREIKKNQYKSVKEPPFDWWEEAAKAIDKIIASIKKNGVAKLTFQY